MIPRLSTPRARLIAGALAAALFFALGFAGGWIYRELDAPGDNSAEAGFARDMSLHHAQAVEMGMFAYRLAEAGELRTIAYDIVTNQQYQIGMMQTWLEEWHLSPVPPDRHMAWMGEDSALLPDGRMPGMASDDEVRQLKSSTGRTFDILFCQLMLRHHLGGVHMAEEVVKRTDRTEVKEMAQQVVTSQGGEIGIFNDLLTRWGAKPIQ